jgi:hypothetical protein
LKIVLCGPHARSIALAQHISDGEGDPADYSPVKCWPFFEIKVDPVSTLHALAECPQRPKRLTVRWSHYGLIETLFVPGSKELLDCLCGVEIHL